MKVAILAGGKGTRLAEETHARPKGLVEIGGKPILWHILRYYEAFGFREFVIALGYMKESFRDYFRQLEQEGEHGSWKVELVDTGEETNTGGRIKRLGPYLGDETFMLTWCDGLADVDLHALLRFHESHGRLATLTAAHPPPRFGKLDLDGATVTRFAEKEVDPNDWINGAFFVLEPEVLDYVDGDETSWDHVSLTQLSRERQLMAYRHETFWQCMDNIHDRETLRKVWDQGAAPWKKWS